MIIIEPYYSQEFILQRKAQKRRKEQAKNETFAEMLNSEMKKLESQKEGVSNV